MGVVLYSPDGHPGVLNTQDSHWLIVRFLKGRDCKCKSDRKIITVVVTCLMLASFRRNISEGRRITIDPSRF